MSTEYDMYTTVWLLSHYASLYQMYSTGFSFSGTSFTIMMQLYARSRLHNCTYTLHCTYMKTRPPVKPIATTTSLVQNGQSSSPFLISCAVLSISTQRDQTTQIIAMIWNDTEHMILRRSLFDISNDFHCK